MIIKHISVACMLTLGVLSLQGCASDVANDANDANAENDGDETTAESGLSAAADRLVGSYVSDGSKGGQSWPLIGGLSLERDGSFFSDIDTGIRCIQAPCPSQVRLKGTFTATGTKLTLRPNDGSPKEVYSYTAVSTEFGVNSIVLSQVRIGNSWKNNLVKANGAYCRDANDCAKLPRPAVQGAGFKCEANSCKSTNEFTTRPKLPSKCLAALCAPGLECVDAPTTAAGIACVSFDPAQRPTSCFSLICRPGTECVSAPGTEIGIICAKRLQ